MGKRFYHRQNLYHLTPLSQITSVKKRGLIADHDPKGLGRLWLCERDQAERIARHLTSLRPLEWHFVLCEVVRWRLTGKLVKHSSSPGVYIYYGNIPVDHFSLIGRIVVMADGSGVSSEPLKEVQA